VSKRVSAGLRFVVALSFCLPSLLRGQTNSQSCNRACLAQISDDYLQALAAHMPVRIRTGPRFRMTENGEPTTFDQGIWRSAWTVGRYKPRLIDGDSSQVAVQTLLLSDKEIVQVLIRLRAPSGAIDEAEMVVARAGETCCWAPDRLDSLPPIFDRNQSGSTSRADLIATADAYFEAVHTTGTPEYRRAPIAPGMNRYENGKQTTNVSVNANRVNRWDAVTQMDSAMVVTRVTHRRYPVVDAETGGVLGIVIFEPPDPSRPRSIITEFFKIGEGKVQEIRTVMTHGARSGWN
jgi:hypothetical protein